MGEEEEPSHVAVSEADGGESGEGVEGGGGEPDFIARAVREG